MAETDEPDRGRAQTASSPPNATVSSSGTSTAPASSSTPNPARTARSLSATRDPSAPGSDKKLSGTKVKDLSHVRCRFFAAGSCTAGASCSFSHEVVAPGTAKPVCKFFTQGNCRFAHKCALAHILPGQPMSFDRKNKRAAQAALREAQAAAADPSSSATPTTTSPNAQSGLAKSLKASGNMGKATSTTSDPSAMTWSRIAAGTTPTSPPQASAPSPAKASTSPGSMWPPESEEGMSSTSRTTSTAISSVAASTESPTKHLSPPSSSLNFISAPSGLSQTMNQQLSSSSNARSSVAAQVMLGQQARRLSNNGESLSPPRMVPSLSRRNEFGMGTSPPLAMASSTSAGNGHAAAATIFGTSPFSGGSRALFMPSSYDSNEDAFPRSPPGKGNMMSDQMRRTSSSGWARPGGTLFGGDNSALEDDAEQGDEDEDADTFNSEGFLPSSLNDLLTPDEVRRRANRNSLGLSSPSSSAFNPFHNSRSVPPDMMLARGRPSMPTTLSSSSLAAGGWGTLSASVEGTNPAALPYSPPASSSFSPRSLASPSALPPRSLLSASRDFGSFTTPVIKSGSPSNSSSFLLAPDPSRNVYSSTFDPPNSKFGHRPAVKMGADLSPALDPLPAPGSLPGGLAAGLSQLHLIPPLHTGDTPPSSLGTNAPIGSPWNAPSALGKSPSVAGAWLSTDGVPPQQASQQQVSAPVKTWANIASSSPTSSGSGLRPPIAAGRRTTSGTAVNGVASPLSKPELTEDEGDERSEEEEMQFSMDA